MGGKSMPEQPVFSSLEDERAELEAVAESLARSPRLARLVRYLGDKYFLGEGDQLHEYNIATEVFGRSKTAFDAGEDAIARVEAHRLRKKLKLFYETEGKDHPVQLWVPSGSYIPVFTHPVSQDASRSAHDESPGQVLDENSSSRQENASAIPTQSEGDDGIHPLLKRWIAGVCGSGSLPVYSLRRKSQKPGRDRDSG
jgi:hypothetical protein